jgi:hypothetical protein
MESTVIDRVLERNCAIFHGVFASDNLPNVSSLHRPLVLVANLDPKSRPGSHWICMYFNNDGGGEYFDSLGAEPKDSFKLYMNKHCDAWTYNNKQLQSTISKFCGHYCIWYCMMKNRRIDMYELLKNSTADTGLNDFLVHRFACKLLLV